jgi:catechol 2,3-dioxygenase-like lactoylglutathione lyase family enzyme
MGLEMILLPVDDVDRAKAFYERMGFTCEVDHEAEGFRVVQFTPPGSGCSIAFGYGLGAVSRSPIVGMDLVVSDLPAAVDELSKRGIELGEPFHYGVAGKAPASTLIMPTTPPTQFVRPRRQCLGPAGGSLSRCEVRKFPARPGPGVEAATAPSWRLRHHCPGP